MAQTVSLGRLFDIRVGIHISWIIIYAIATWSIASNVSPAPLGVALAIGALCALLLFACVIVHEFSHALVARRFGVRTSGITLFIFGGVATIEREPPSPRAEVAIALAGPAASLLIAGAAYAGYRAAGAFPASGANDIVALLFEYLTIANGMLGLFNLIPAFPMDGGRVLRAALWQRTGSQNQATATAAMVGLTFAGVLLCAGVVAIAAFHAWQYSWNIVLGAFLLRATWGSREHALELSRLERVHVRDFMETEYATLPASSELASVECACDTTVVADGGSVVGVLSAREHRLVPLTALPSLNPGSTGIDAVAAFNHCALSHLPVLSEGRLLGVVERTRTLQLQYQKKAA